MRTPTIWPLPVSPLPHVAIAAMTLLAASACLDPDESRVTDLVLADGRSVAGLLDPDKTTVVLLYSTHECFTCNGLLGRWARLGRDRGMDVKLVLTNPPTSRQTVSLRFLRVDLAGVLTTATGDTDPLRRGVAATKPSEARSPSAIVFRGRRQIASAVGQASQVGLLDRLTTPSGEMHATQPHTRR